TVNILFNLKKKNCLGNKKSLSLMSSIVALCFKKSIGSGTVYAPVSFNTHRFSTCIGKNPNDTHPYISVCTGLIDTIGEGFLLCRSCDISGKVSHFAGEGKYADISTKELLKY